MEIKKARPEARAQRTHRLLRGALLRCLRERGWEKTRVQEICDRAGVARSTFYVHFADKEELLLSGFAELRRSVRVSRRSAAAEKPQVLAFVRGLIEHAEANFQTFRALLGKHSWQAAQRRFRALVIDLVREDLSGLVPAGAVREAYAHYLAGALFELLTWWVDSRSPIAALELEAITDRLTKPVIAAIAKPAARVRSAPARTRP